MLFQPDGPKGQQQEAQEDPEPQEAKEIRGRWNPATGGGETGKSCSSIALQVTPGAQQKTPPVVKKLVLGEILKI